MNDNAKPDSLSDSEWEAVLSVRRREAAEAELGQHWKRVLDGFDIASNETDEDWDATASRFCDLAYRHGDWDDEAIEDFAYALMRFFKWRTTRIRNYGIAWVKRSY